MTRTLGRIAGALALAVAVMAPRASAAIDPASYHHVEVLSGYVAPWSTAGGYIYCPAGMRAVASGATSSGLTDVLTAGVTTFDGAGAFLTANGRGGHLQMSARCVPAGQLQTSTLSYRTLRVHPRTPNAPFALAPCPENTVAYGGGGFYTRAGGPPIGSSNVYASMPDPSGTHWFFGAGLPGITDADLWVGTHCLPRREFGQILTVTATDRAPYTVPRAPNYHVIYAAARCPEGYAAYAGGAWLHAAGSTAPAPVGYLTVSNMTSDDRGWFARAWMVLAGSQITTTVKCMST
jgi:hypothetical protein